MNFQLKGFKMKTFQFLLGLVILVAVLWTVTTSANAEADSMIVIVVDTIVPVMRPVALKL